MTYALQRRRAVLPHGGAGGALRSPDGGYAMQSWLLDKTLGLLVPVALGAVSGMACRSFSFPSTLCLSAYRLRVDAAEAIAKTDQRGRERGRQGADAGARRAARTSPLEWSPRTDTTLPPVRRFIRHCQRLDLPKAAGWA